jgi:predicted transglutaminase-like protease
MKTNMKKKLIATLTVLREKSSRICNRFQGYCPVSDELENSKIKSLAIRLKANSYRETLTNILEWQERNIDFWTERHPIVTILPPVGLLYALSASIGPLVLLLMMLQNIELLWLLPWFIVIPFVMFVSSIVTTLAIVMVILHSNRKFPWKEIPICLKNILLPSISIDFLLENKLGVCRDYAKLTACLLSNTYPKAEIHFASAPNHTATGIYVKDRLYMLDQRLPILTIDRWIDYRRHKKSDTIKRFDPSKQTPQKVDKEPFLHTKIAQELNTERLAKRIAELLNIKERTNAKAFSLEILWKKGSILYEEDEMVDYSLARWLEMQLSDELIKINQIIKVEINPKKDDLAFLIRFCQTE